MYKVSKQKCNVYILFYIKYINLDNILYADFIKSFNIFIPIIHYEKKLNCTKLELQLVKY